MARGRSSSHRDGNSPVSSDPLAGYSLPAPSPSPLVDPLLDDPLLSFEDRRLWTPTPYAAPSMRPASDLVAWVGKGVVNYPRHMVQNALYDISGRRYYDRARAYKDAAIAFRDPRRVAVCVRRKIRREVIFALKIHKRFGSGRGKGRRQNWLSAIRC